MTRDDAIRILVDHVWPACDANVTAAQNWVDAWKALGILKLDEPKSASIDGLLVPMRAVTALNDSGWDLRLFKVLDAAGLRIVEK